MNHEAMLAALRNKKARGLDSAILIAPMHAGGGEALHQDDISNEHEGHEGHKGEEHDDSKEMDLAPSDAAPLGDEHDEMNAEIGHIAHDKNMMPGEEIVNHPEDQDDAKLIAHALAQGHFGKRSVAHRMQGKGGKGTASKPLAASRVGKSEY